MQLSIIILSFNKQALLSACLQSVFATIKSISFEVIVLDNASSDDSVQMVKKKFPQVHLIENKTNLGFGNGINEATKYAQGEFFLFLNNDTTILEEHIDHIISFYKQGKNVGIIGGSLYNTDGSPQRSYSSFYSLSKVFTMLFFGEHFTSSDVAQTKIVDWVTGACMLIKKDFFEALGKYDENIFMYVEDMEICWRVHNKGYNVYFSPDLKVKHMGQGSSNRDFAIIHIYKNLLYFYHKHRSRTAYLSVKTLLYLKAYLVIIGGTLSGEKALVHRYKQAIKF